MHKRIRVLAAITGALTFVALHFYFQIIRAATDQGDICVPPAESWSILLLVVMICSPALGAVWLAHNIRRLEAGAR